MILSHTSIPANLLLNVCSSKVDNEGLINFEQCWMACKSQGWTLSGYIYIFNLLTCSSSRCLLYRYTGNSSRHWPQGRGWAVGWRCKCRDGTRTTQAGSFCHRELQSPPLCSIKVRLCWWQSLGARAIDYSMNVAMVKLLYHHIALIKSYRKHVLHIFGGFVRDIKIQNNYSYHLTTCLKVFVQ